MKIAPFLGYVYACPDCGCQHLIEDLQVCRLVCHCSPRQHYVPVPAQLRQNLNPLNDFATPGVKN